MQITAEISLYPLQREYGHPILAFIESLRGAEGIRIQTNTMSTEIIGEYERVMEVLSIQLKPFFEVEDTVVLVVKMVNRTDF